LTSVFANLPTYPGSLSRYLFVDLWRRTLPKSAETWLERLSSFVIFSAFGIPIVLSFFPALGWLSWIRIDNVFSWLASGETLLTILIAIMVGLRMTESGLGGSIFVLISALLIGFIGERSFDSLLPFWSGLAVGLAAGWAIAPLVDFVVGAIIVIGVLILSGNVLAWAAVQAGGSFDGDMFIYASMLSFIFAYVRPLRYLLLHLPKALYLSFQAHRNNNFDPSVWAFHPLRTDETIRFPLPGLTSYIKEAFRREGGDARGLVLHCLSAIGAVQGQRVILPGIINSLLRDEIRRSRHIFDILRFRETLSWLPITLCSTTEQALLAKAIQITDRLYEAIIVPPREQRAILEDVANQIEQTRRGISFFSFIQVNFESSLRGRWQRIQDNSRRRRESPASQLQMELFMRGPFFRITPPTMLFKYRTALSTWEQIIQQSLNDLRSMTGKVATVDENGKIVRFITAGSPDFQGRAEFLQKVEEIIVNEQQRTSLIMLGQPSVGKTAMLHQLQTSLSPSVVPVVCDLHLERETFNEDAPIVMLLIENIRWFAQQSKYGISIRPFAYELCQSKADFYKLCLAWIDDAVIPMLGKDQKLLLVFDHYDVPGRHESYFDIDDEFFDLLREMIDRDVINVMLCGNIPPENSDPRWLGTLSGATDIRRLMTPLLDIKSASRILHYIVAGETSFHLSNESISLICRETGCHPYLLQLVAALTSSLIVQQGKDLQGDGIPDEAGIVRNAIDVALKRMDSFMEYYSSWLEHFTDKPEVIADLFVSRATKRSENNETDPHLLAIARETLQEWQVIIADDEQVQFTVPLIASWIRRPFSD
jgi:hypothetical protein